MNTRLLLTMAGIGALCGAMFNHALGYTFYKPGGIMGGLVTGLLMFLF